MIFDEPRFLPGGDTFVLVHFGDDARIDLNFMALGLTAALREDRTNRRDRHQPLLQLRGGRVRPGPDRRGRPGAGAEAPDRGSRPGRGPGAGQPSRLHPGSTTATPGPGPCVEDYAERIAPRGDDHDFVARINGLEDSAQLVRVHSGDRALGGRRVLDAWPAADGGARPALRHHLAQVQPAAHLDDAGRHRRRRPLHLDLHHAGAGRLQPDRPHPRCRSGTRKQAFPPTATAWCCWTPPTG